MLLSRVAAQTIQLLIYIRRNPSLSYADFDSKWQNELGPLVVPLAEKYGFVSYEQVRYSAICARLFHLRAGCTNRRLQLHTTGNIASDVNPTLQAFDGIVMLELPSLETLQDAFSDPYYTNTIAPAEQQIFDWVNFPQGVVASFNGSLVKVVENGKGVTSD